MRIKYFEIKNFRKLKACRIELGDKQTIFVGANNSGKTSAMDAMILFLKTPGRLSTLDFTVSNWNKINEVGEKWLSDEQKPLDIFRQECTDLLPSLDVWIDVEDSEIHYVSHLIPTLSWSGGLVGVRLVYEPDNLEEFFEQFIKSSIAVKGLSNGKDGIKLWPESLRDFLDKKKGLFKVKAYLLDPDQLKLPLADAAQIQSLQIDAEALENKPFEKLFQIDLINAQRGFSDPNNQSEDSFQSNKLSSQLHSYYSKHLDPNKNVGAQDVSVLKAVSKSKKVFDDQLKESFKSSIGELEDLGYPGFSNPRITLSSQLNPIDLLNHESAVFFDVADDAFPMPLPEKYNGLGYQNLVSMVFRLIGFRDSWQRKGKLFESIEDGAIEPIHLVLVEEPEAHLHAQIQQVFIRKAYDVLVKNVSDELTTQLIVSSHSSHIAHEVEFADLRYFKRNIAPLTKEAPTAVVVNLSEVFGSADQTAKFVTRYLKATHCDLFFADAAILVEGTAEKMLIPHFIRNHYKALDSRYITILEIGGSHAHRLQPLIDRLGVITFVVADIDAQKGSLIEKNKMSLKKTQTKPKDAQISGNTTLKTWMPGEDKIDDLLDLTDDKKIRKHVRIGYQTPINLSNGEKVYPYTFEDSLVLTNAAVFSEIKGAKGLLKKMVDASKLTDDKLTVKEATEDMFKALEKGSKGEMALELLFLEDPSVLKAPIYIEEGLVWLEGQLKPSLKSDASLKEVDYESAH